MDAVHVGILTTRLCHISQTDRAMILSEIETDDLPIVVPAVAEDETAAKPEPTGQSDRRVIIELQNLSKSYTEGVDKRIVLDELNRVFYAGEFVCLLGKSGSGKSTLLNLISGIDAPSAGDVIVFDDAGSVVINRLNEHKRTLFRRRNIGIVFQFFNLIPTLTVMENVTLPMELAGSTNQREHAVYIARSRWACQSIGHLSRQAQRRRTAARGHCSRTGPRSVAHSGRRTDRQFGRRYG